MTKTLLTRISILSQYNSENKTILWEDPTSNRWENVYGKLVENDNAIFISNDKLLIGLISQVNKGKSLLCINIREVSCQNDQFLRLHVAYPELISRVKANFQPFIHPFQLDLDQLIKDAENQNFVDFYILSDENKYNDLFSSFKENDRIVLLNNNLQLQNVKLSSVQGLIEFPKQLNIHISVKGQTIDEILLKNKNYKRKTNRSNNVTRIEKLKNDIITNGIFKFTSFFAYYDTLINKSVYEKSDSKIKTIDLNPNETIFKVSMSGKDISDEAFTFLNDNNLIIVHNSTKAKGISYQSQSDTFGKQMKIGDYFYMCRGNSNLEIIGRITSGIIPCEYKDFGIHGWMQRSYEIISETIRDESYTEGRKWWTPNDNSTCIAIPSKEIEQANIKLFTPFFDTQFKLKNNLLTTIFKSNEIMSKNLNQILYGPPGTGKTYNSINEALEIINEEEEQQLDWNDRKAIKNLFDQRVNEGRIAFTTFHQSMSYEDFIEGIKPEEPEKEGDPVIYKIKYGIFRNLCIEASFEIAQLRENDSTEEVLDFSFLYDSLVENIEEQLIEGNEVELEIKTGAKVLVDSISQNGNVIIKHVNGKKTYTVSKNRLTKLNSEIKDLDKVTNIADEFKSVIGGSNSSADRKSVV